MQKLMLGLALAIGLSSMSGCHVLWQRHLAHRRAIARAVVGAAVVGAAVHHAAHHDVVVRERTYVRPRRTYTETVYVEEGCHH